MLYTLLHPIRLIPTFLLFQVEDRALEDSVRILTKFEDMANSFSLDNVFRYDVSVDVAPEVRWLSEDKYKNLKVVVEIDEIVDAEKAAEIELKRRHKALGLLRIVADRGLQVKYFGFSLVCYK
jgi:trigger factor